MTSEVVQCIGHRFEIQLLGTPKVFDSKFNYGSTNRRIVCSCGFDSGVIRRYGPERRSIPDVFYSHISPEEDPRGTKVGKS